MNIIENPESVEIRGEQVDKIVSPLRIYNYNEIKETDDMNGLRKLSLHGQKEMSPYFTVGTDGFVNYETSVIQPEKEQKSLDDFF